MFRRCRQWPPSHPPRCGGIHLPSTATGPLIRVAACCHNRKYDPGGEGRGGRLFSVFCKPAVGLLAGGEVGKRTIDFIIACRERICRSTGGKARDGEKY
ncbi:hypothetical protein [Methanogenium cariaci]|uniref:hypothetical protein n=1 Tax=Methanogenium cariaci TaxID=2197 RepID=UPI0012F68E2D|nr:hypothetical protein [Methanogenium cariaci]